jgi:hypothetical protein
MEWGLGCAISTLQGVHAQQGIRCANANAGRAQGNFLHPCEISNTSGLAALTACTTCCLLLTPHPYPDLASFYHPASTPEPTPRTHTHTHIAKRLKIVVFYIIAATIFLSLALTAYVAVVGKGAGHCGRQDQGDGSTASGPSQREGVCRCGAQRVRARQRPGAGPLSPGAPGIMLRTRAPHQLPLLQHPSQTPVPLACHTHTHITCTCRCLKKMTAPQEAGWPGAAGTGKRVSLREKGQLEQGQTAAVIAVVHACI